MRTRKESDSIGSGNGLRAEAEEGERDYEGFEGGFRNEEETDQSEDADGIAKKKHIRFHTDSFLHSFIPSFTHLILIPILTLLSRRVSN